MSSNDVKNVIINRINNLLNVKDLSNWSENLSSFFEAYRTHPALAPVFEAIRKKKLNEHKPFFQAYQAFANELSRLLKELERELQSIDNLLLFPWELVNELPFSKNLDDPFYQPEAQFFEACKILRRFIEGFIENISKYEEKVSSKCLSLLTAYLNIFTRVIYKHSVTEESLKQKVLKNFLCRTSLNFEGKIECHFYQSVFDLEFKSPIFHKLLTEAENLAYSKNAALWKKLDNLDKWVIWTAKGIHPGNLTHKRNLFDFLKIEEAVKSLSDYLLDYLMKDEQLPEPTKQNPLQLSTFPQIRSLSIFPYKTSSLDNYVFWIIASYPDGTFTPHYVRKINSGSETHKFVEILLQLQRDDVIELEDVSSPRAELALTKELGKVFFYKSGTKRTAFRGFQVFLNEVAEKIDAIKLQKQLSRLNKQQDIPKFLQEEHQAFLKGLVARSEIPTSSDAKR